MIEWKALGDSLPPVKELLTALEKQKKSSDWKADDGAKIPDMCRWLKKKRWEDEIEDKPKKQIKTVEPWEL